MFTTRNDTVYNTQTYGFHIVNIWFTNCLKGINDKKHVIPYTEALYQRNAYCVSDTFKLSPKSCVVVG